MSNTTNEKTVIIFGGCLTPEAYELLRQTPEEDRDKVLAELLGLEPKEEPDEHKS